MTSDQSTPGSEQSGPSEGPDPWCTWCDFEPPDGELPYRIKGEDDGRWPPAFCSLQCAARWGNAVHQDRIYHVERGRGLRTDGGSPDEGEELGSWADAHDAFVERKLRRAIGDLEADCELCGNAVEPATEREMHICRKCLREDVQVADRVATDGGQPSTDTERSESRVDRWFYREYEWSEVFVGLRGKMATKAVDHDTETGRKYPVIVEPDELDEYDEIPTEEVDGWARENIENRFAVRAKNLELVTGVSLDE